MFRTAARIKKWIAGFSIAALITAAPFPAYAADPVAAVIGAAVTAAMYKTCLSGVLKMGNDVHAQINAWKQDIKENGRDKNQADHRAVDAVMEQLTENGRYVLKANSLPFKWDVNDNDMFNASCYPVDYVSVNKGLVRVLNADPDEMAAVLGHEMTHGLMQHSAHSYAKAAAQTYGAAFLGMAIGGNFDWNAMSALVNYNISQNIVLPNEYEADRGGFNLMASAGFNPGGGAAALYRMQYYMQYETKNIWEYHDPKEPVFSDHPSDDLRVKRLSEQMTAYGADHVTVKDARAVYIDGKHFIDAQQTSDRYDNTTENAYLIAGAISKAFHDYDTPEGWNFRNGINGRREYLDDNRVYALLKRFTARGDNAARLEQMVYAAYAGESKSHARVKLKKREAEFNKALEKERKALKEAPNSLVRQLRYNGDIYSDYGMGKEALFQVQRAFGCDNQDSMAGNYSIRGRAKAVLGDFDGALADSAEALKLDPKNVYCYLNRADVYRMMGKRSEAVADCEYAKKLEPANPIVWKISGDVYAGIDEKDKALADYKQYNKLAPEARDIPEEYWVKVQPEIAAREKAEREKKEAEKAAKKKDTLDKKDIAEDKNQGNSTAVEKKENEKTVGNDSAQQYKGDMNGRA